MYHLGSLYNAKTWYLESAKKGYGKAMLKIGELYHTGKGVPKSSRKAKYWFRQLKITYATKKGAENY